MSTLLEDARRSGKSDEEINQDKPVVMMLIKAGMVKRLIAEGLIRIQ